MLPYDDAVSKWGITILQAYPNIRKDLDESSVTVEFILNEGFSCCGGSNPECYCSYAETPSLKAVISYTLLKSSRSDRKLSIEYSHLDFSDTLRELFEVGAK